MKEIFTQRIATGNDSNSETLVHFQLIAIPGFGTLTTDWNAESRLALHVDTELLVFSTVDQFGRSCQCYKNLRHGIE
jgi:hypothetical protein